MHHQLKIIGKQSPHVFCKSSLPAIKKKTSTVVLKITKKISLTKQLTTTSKKTKKNSLKNKWKSRRVTQNSLKCFKQPQIFKYLKASEENSKIKIFIKIFQPHHLLRWSKRILLTNLGAARLQKSQYTFIHLYEPHILHKEFANINIRYT